MQNVELDIESLRKALLSLKDVYTVYTQIEREDLTMNNIFRYMEGYGFTSDRQNWKLFYEKRSYTAPEYNLEKARCVIEIIPQLIDNVEYMLKKWDSL